MLQQSNRISKINALILKELTTIMRSSLQNELITWAQITAVETAKDLSAAKVFVSHLYDDKLAEAVAFLNNKQSFLYRQLFAAMHTKRVPKLTFKADKTLLQASQLNELYDK